MVAADVILPKGSCPDGERSSRSLTWKHSFCPQGGRPYNAHARVWINFFYRLPTLLSWKEICNFRIIINTGTRNFWKEGWIFFSSASVQIFTFSIVFFANQLPRKFATSAFRALKTSVTLLCSRYSRLLAGSYIRIGLAPGCRNLSARHCNKKRFYHDDIDNPGKYLNRTAHPIIGVCFGKLCSEISESARKHPSTGISRRNWQCG